MTFPKSSRGSCSPDSLPRYGKPRGEPHRLLQRAGIGAALAYDVESSPVRGRGEHGAQAARDRHPAVEALELGRNLSLIVIHGKHAVVVACKGFQEYGVGGERAAARDAALSGARHRWGDDVELFAPEQPAFAGVRVERRD